MCSSKMVSVGEFLSTLTLGIDVRSSLYRLIKYVLRHSTNGNPIRVTSLKRLVTRPHEFHTRLPILKNILKNRFGVILKAVNVPRSARVLHFITHAKSPKEPLYEMDPENRPGSILLKYVLTYLFLRGGKVEDKDLYNTLYSMGIDVDGDDNYFGTGVRRLIKENFIEMELLKCERIKDPLGNTPTQRFFTWGDRAQILFTYDIVIQYDHKRVKSLLNDIKNQPPASIWK